MAKSARSSSTKKNNATLRAKIFGPAHDARTERLSAKLQEIAAKPRPDQERRMEVDAEEGQKQDEQPTSHASEEDMDLDYQLSNSLSRKTKSDRRHGSRRTGGGRIAKRKSKNAVVFPSIVAKQKRQAAAAARRKK